MKIRPVKAELFRADRQTDGRTGATNWIVAFRNIAKAPENVIIIIIIITVVPTDAHNYKIVGMLKQYSHNCYMFRFTQEPSSGSYFVLS